MGMTSRTRRLLAVALSIWLLLLGGSPASYAMEIDHELTCVQLVDDGRGEAADACIHGCAGHHASHSVTIPVCDVPAALGSLEASPVRTADRFRPGSPSEPFYPPPKVSLT